MKKSIYQIKNTFSISKLLFGIISIFVFLFNFNFAIAQNNLNVTFRTGVNYPTKDLGDVELQMGGGFETMIAYRFMPHFEAYTGWGWNTMSESAAASVAKIQYEETGYSFGLRFIHPLSSKSKLSYLIGGGGIYNHIETENIEGDIINDTEHGLGWQVDAGISIPIGHHDRWTIVPTMRYHELSRDVTFEGVSESVDLNYFSVGVSLTWILWKAKN